MIRKFEQFSVMALEEKEILEVEPIIHKKIIELNEFFEIKPKLSVQIIYSPHEFEFYKGEFQNWMVGTASKHHLWIFSKNLIETLTLHKKECFEQVLKYEMSHTYTNTLSPFVPIWINEGIAVYLSENLEERKKKLKEYNLDLFEKNKELKEIQIKNYVIAPCFVEYLINKYGKKIFLEFIKEFKLSIDINQLSKTQFGNDIRSEFKYWKEST